MMVWLIAATVHATPIASWDFEDGLDGGSVTSALQWEWGAFADADRPDGAGRFGWATQLDGNHRNDARDELVLNSVDLTGVPEPVLAIRHWYAIDPISLFDAGWVEAAVDGELRIIEPVYGYPSSVGFSGFSDGLVTSWFDLSGADPDTAIHLVFASDIAVSFPGWSVDAVELYDGDAVPPLFLEVSELEDSTAINAEFPVTVRVIDDTGIADVSLWWSENGAPPIRRTMNSSDGERYEGTIDGQASGTDVTWWVSATDGINTAVYPPVDTEQFRVALPPPTNVRMDHLGNSNRLAAQSAVVRWDAPADGDFTPIRYDIERDGLAIASSTTLRADVPLVDGTQSLQVRGVFTTDAGPAEGDPSEPLHVDVAYPVAQPPLPDRAWPGDRIRVTIEGTHLYLAASDELTANDGATPGPLAIIDAHRAIALVAIDPDAAPGPIELTLQTQRGPIPLGGPLTVLAEGDAPRVIAVRPSVARQGARLTVFVDLGTSIAVEAVQAVDFGPGVFVEAIRARTTGFDADIVIDRAAPLGTRGVNVDTNDRILSGAELTIRDGRNAASTACAQSGAPRPADWVALIAVGWIGVRRRRLDARPIATNGVHSSGGRS
ncbi:MAG: hypothetical protein VX944_03075 [Myxococcota bacterium]|nr:hypothetical protein [Myxococcota bacterium]